jgi:hypothetical protein
MKAKNIIFHFITAWFLFLSTVVGLTGVEEFEGGYLWELMCTVSPLLLGIQIHVLYLKFKNKFFK